MDVAPNAENSRTKDTFLSRTQTRYELVAAHDLKQIDAHGRWQSTGNDPQFALLPEVGQALPSGWIQLDIAIEYHENSRRARLYWDDGNGYHERHCHLLPIPISNRVCTVVPLPKDIVGLRLDPLDCTGEFTLKSFSLRPMSKLRTLAHLIKPYPLRAIRNPSYYTTFIQQFIKLWWVRGMPALKMFFVQLATAQDGTAARIYMQRELHAYEREKSAVARPALAPLVGRIARTSIYQKKSQRMQIAIGLVEHFGDIVACEPIARYLKQQSPDADIVWVVREPYRELIDSNPYIDRTIAVDCLTDWIKLVAHDVFDRVIDLHVNERICSHCNIPLFKKSGDLSITGNNYFNFGNLLRSFCIGAGIAPLDQAPQVYISEEIKSTVDALHLPPQFVVFHCCSNSVFKDWDFPKWNALATYLTNTLQISIVEIGLEPVLQSDNPKVINLCGRLSLLETAETIRRASLFVGVESGPAHLANAVNTFGIILIGQLAAFTHYNPYSGGYGDGSNALLVRNESGPASTLQLDQVQKIIEFKLSEGSQKNQTHAEASSVFTLEQSEKSTNSELPRLIAFYLPQYHPIPLNDDAWGKGFTEWRNVGKSRAYFKEQYQPRLPGELGYYDLRVPEVMEQQAELARDHSIHGFCYYLYWFQGKRLLNLPIDNMLRQRKPDMPFCFCWANENWTRRWDGAEKEILMAQNHTHEDDIKFIRHMIPAFDDPRYIRINGRPLLLIYRTELFPDPMRTVDTWRTELRKAGLGDPYLVRCEGFDPWTTPEDIGFDASYEVPTFILPDELRYENLASLGINPEFNGRIFDYEKIVRWYSEREDVPYRRFKDVMLAWDNTPRHDKNAVVFHNVSPEKYGEWLKNAMRYTMKKFKGEERIVFINAWNEWAEGSYLEPDLRYGKSFLEATKKSFDLIAAQEIKSRLNDAKHEYIKSHLA